MSSLAHAASSSTQNIDHSLCNFLIAKPHDNQSDPEVIRVWTALHAGVQRLSQHRMVSLRFLGQLLGVKEDDLVTEECPLVPFTLNPSLGNIGGLVLLALGLTYHGPAMSRPLDVREPKAHQFARFYGISGDWIDGFVISLSPLIILTRRQNYYFIDANDPRSYEDYIHQYGLARLNPSQIKAIDWVNPINLNEPMSDFEILNLLETHPELRLVPNQDIQQTAISTGSDHSVRSASLSFRDPRARNSAASTLFHTADPADLLSVHIGWWRPLIGHAVPGHPYVLKVSSSSGDKYIQIRTDPLSGDLPSHIDILPGSRPTEELRRFRNGDAVLAEINNKIYTGTIHFRSNGITELSNIPNESEAKNLSSSDLINHGLFSNYQDQARIFLDHWLALRNQQSEHNNQSLSLIPYIDQKTQRLGGVYQRQNQPDGSSIDLSLHLIHPPLDPEIQSGFSLEGSLQPTDKVNSPRQWKTQEHSRHNLNFGSLSDSYEMMSFILGELSNPKRQMYSLQSVTLTLALSPSPSAGYDLRFTLVRKSLEKSSELNSFLDELVDAAIRIHGTNPQRNRQNRENPHQ